MRRSWLRRKATSRATFHLTTGQSVEGSIAWVAKDGVVLRGAVLLGEPEKGQPDTPMAGETFVPRERILLVQGA